MKQIGRLPASLAGFFSLVVPSWGRPVLFLFIDRETLGASNPLDVEWMSGKGERVRLGE